MIGCGFLISIGYFSLVWNTLFGFLDQSIEFSSSPVSRLVGLPLMALGSYGLLLNQNIPYHKSSIILRCLFGGVGIPLQMYYGYIPKSSIVIWFLDVVPCFILGIDLYQKGYYQSGIISDSNKQKKE
jgi:hypothetical protein